MKATSKMNKDELEKLGRRYGFTAGASSEMVQAVVAGDGRMAQFDNSEFGGQGQWLAGGMTMIGETSNDELKTRVTRLCEELARLVNDPTRTDFDLADETRGSSDSWWPSELGSASSSGSQGRLRYAYFAKARRLAVDDGAFITLYDTDDNNIRGVSQMSSHERGVTFASQHGPVDVSSLRRISRMPTSA